MTMDAGKNRGKGQGQGQGEIADVGSPVLTGDDPAGRDRPLAATTVVLLTATAFLTFANAHALGAWFDQLTPNAWTERLRAPIAWWTDTSAAWHLDDAREALHRRWQAARAARFATGQVPG